MQFSLVFVLTGLLASLAAANPNPQSPAQTTDALEALGSYISSVKTNSAYLGLQSSISTDTAALASLTAFEASLSKQLAAHETPSPNFLDGLPSQYRPFWSSFVSVESAILNTKGVTSQLPTSTSKAGAAPRETGALKVAGVVAAGFVGAVMAL